MGATFSRTKTWSAGDILTAADQNAEFDNILNNLTTAGMDDYSANVTEMRATTDPYPSGAESLATSLQGEITRLRYVIKQITGEAQWMIDPDTDLATINTNVITGKGAASGYASLDANTQAVETPAQMTLIPAFENYRNLIVQTNATNPTFQVDIDADAVLVANSTGTFKKLSSVNRTVDITANGADGLDTPSEASSTWYHLWIIAKADGTTAGLLSTSTTLAGLTMPTDYTFGGYVGAVRNDGSSNFIAFYQVGKYVSYNANQNIKNGTFTTAAWTSQSVAAFFPTTALFAKFMFGSQGTNFGLSPLSTGYRGDYMQMANNAVTGSFGGILTTAREGIAVLRPFYAATMYYFVSHANSTLDAMGWEY